MLALLAHSLWSPKHLLCNAI
uniref:Uncharacterized protein n=1 Tax=Rhizophora mucronata TaxID=61149 RepID=A0A2P2QUR5_RHIMU